MTSHATDRQNYKFVLQFCSTGKERLPAKRGKLAKLNQNQVNKARKDLQNEARQRVAKRGILQIRTDPETILAVISIAEEREIAVGKLLRQWIEERLELEQVTKKTPDLLERLSVLEETVSYLTQKLK